MIHKWYDVIVAFAEGRAIQFKAGELGQWTDWADRAAPAFSDFGFYRIKPEPKPDVVSYLYFSLPWDLWREIKTLSEGQNIKIVRDGETGEIKHVELVR